MNDETEKPVDESAAEEAAPACGERLAEARRNLQVTVLEIAKELHLDEPKVRALECNDFETLGAPVFAKGYMRKYAEIVGVDPDDVLADYYKLTRSSGMPPLVHGGPKVRKEISPGPWIAVVVVILAALLAYWLIVKRDTPSNGVESMPAIEELQPSTSNEIEMPVLEPAPQAETTVAQDLPAAMPATVADVAPDVATTSSVEAEDDEQDLSDGQLSVALIFTGECWTEISDADGRRLFFDMGRDGRNVELTGKAPISALFGNTDNVSLQVNGSAYAIPAAGRRGQTARFTIQNPQI